MISTSDFVLFTEKNTRTEAVFMLISDSLLKRSNDHHLLEKNLIERAFSDACSAVVFLAGVVMRQCSMQMFKCVAV